jgi:hypothetical protein
VCLFYLALHFFTLQSASDLQVARAIRPDGRESGVQFAQKQSPTVERLERHARMEHGMRVQMSGFFDLFLSQGC